MPVQNEKRVLWHPRHTDKFVVGGASQITLYELSDEQPEIRHVTSQHDLQFMKCFAWSPAKIPSDIFAVGHSSGRVDLLRLEASRYSQLGPDESVLAAGPILSLPVRNQRSCNALAFCPSDPNYLAVGLDKVSRDSSLVIWDVQEEIGVFRAAINLADDANVMSSFSKESFGKLSTYPPIPRTDYPVRADQRIVQAHAQTEVISSLAWLSQSTHPYLLLAGISSRWLRLFDLRNPAGSVAGVSYVSSIAAKVTGIATDPFDGTRFLTWGDGVVTIWDTRKLQTSKIHSDFANGAPSPTPLLTFSEKDAGVDDSPSTLQSSYVAAEFSPSRRGIIATLAKDANYVRLWDVLEAGGSSMRREVEDVDEKIIKLKDKAPVSRKSWANLPWGNSINSLESKDPSSVHEGENIEQSRHPTLILHNARRGISAPNPLCSFAIVPPVYSSHQSKSKLVVVSQSGEITVQSVYNAARTLTWSSRGDMLYGPLEFVNKDNSNAGFGVVNGHHEEQEERDMEEHIHTTSGVQASPNLAGSTPNSKSFVASEQKELHERGRPRNPISFQEILPSPALFGRGDAEGFPALSRPLGENHISANLAATKPVDGHGEEKKRTYSPAAALRVPLRATNALSSPSISAIPHDGLSTPVKLPESKESVVESRKTFISDVAATDVSVLMRRRAMRGYSIRDPLRNASVIRELARSRNSTTTMEFEEPTKESKMLADLWEWIYHSQNFLSSPTPLLHGYDFSFAGVWGIWDGPASNGGSGIISRYRDLSAHNTETSTNMFGSHSSNSGSNASGSVSSTQNMLSGSKRTRTRSPVTKLANDTEWHQALLDLFARTTEPLPASRLPIFPYISTSQPLQRHICLHLIGWGFVVRDDSLMAEVRRWEQESEGDEGYARAAAWLVFTGRYGGGVGVSNEADLYLDESHHMMSGVIAALAPFASATLSSLRTTSKLVLPSPLREHYARLINRLQNSYLRALLTHLTAISSSAAPNPEHWLEILHDEEDLLPFYERLALAFCFLDDTALSTYLRRCREHALSKNGGDVDALVVTGLGTPEGREIISLWLDRLGDVQSAALLGWTGLGRLMPKIDSRVIRWVESYRDFLDSVKLFHCRVEFDIERGETLQITLDHRTTGSAPRQILIRCNYCNKTVASNTGPTTCPNCGRALPRCSICLMTLGIVPDAYREIELSHSQYRGKSQSRLCFDMIKYSADTMDDAILLCLGCRHGGHASHILQWFFGQDGAILSHRLCPVADCAHQCGNEF
ncbi:hypothetical protein J3R30DRAFT_3284977 [Lentinula aciculospora]|uniref:GATOR2 complex protein MIO zinc-ribbon like domain-containing protein n=1 Tax=Lentinula aciculospora TaxID=153920 RepID=A0A9W9DSC8_9AGAR|nr:hypothetical protein J3R30DRAFT_3284977 [Lentinula aciculospora]